jgi:simple sugar transport system permease protein
MSTTFAIFSASSYWAMLLTLAAPLLLGVVGELICERAGVLNLGIAGTFVAGALVALLIVQASKEPWDGLIVAGAAGVVIGMTYGLLIGPLHLPQPITGIAVTMLSIGLCYFIVLAVFPDLARIPSTPQVAHFEGLADLPSEIARIPFIGEPLSRSAAVTFLTQAFARTSSLTGLAVIAAIVVAYALYRTPFGLVIRACGNNPHAVFTQGQSVNARRVGAVAVGSGLMAMGGAAMIIGAAERFSIDVIAGNGFLCVGLVAIAAWRIGRAMLVVLLFAAMQAYHAGLVQSSGISVATQITAILPYLLAIIGLVVMSGNRRRPLALPNAFRPGQFDTAG